MPILIYNNFFLLILLNFEKKEMIISDPYRSELKTSQVLYLNALFIKKFKQIIGNIAHWEKSIHYKYITHKVPKLQLH